MREVRELGGRERGKRKREKESGRAWKEEREGMAKQKMEWKEKGVSGKGKERER